MFCFSNQKHWNKLFQFQYGAIRWKNWNFGFVGFPSFQFQYGAIRCTDVVLESSLQFCFNSNMVRLDVVSSFSSPYNTVCFNSNMVRLDVLLFLLCLRLCLRCFNSNMVRLDDRNETNPHLSLICFNSNMVRLDVDDDLGLSLTFACFNSNMVRLDDKGRWWSG